MRTVRYLSLEQAHIYTGISTRTLRRRIAEGELTAYRQGTGTRIIRLDIADLDAMFNPLPAGTSGEAIFPTP